MSDNAPRPTADQIAAFQRLDKILGNADQPFGDENWAEVRKWLPDALTNPQPALPTEPGVYSLPARSQAHLGHWHTDGIELHYLNAEGNWCDVGWGNALVSEKRAFTRLVPEPAAVTAHDLWVASGNRPTQSSMPVVYQRMSDYVNGTRA